MSPSVRERSLAEPSLQPPAPRLWLFDPQMRAAALALLAGLGALGMILLGSRFFPPSAGAHVWVLPVAAAAALGGAAVVALRPRWVFPGFLLACMVIPSVLEETSIPLGFMKLYVQDLVFLFNVCLILWRASLGRWNGRNIAFNRLVIIYFVLGIWGLFHGLFISKFAFDYTFGDFRRASFYFLNYFIALYLTDNLEDTRRLRNMLTVGGVLIILNGLYQVATGRFYYRSFADAAHVLSHYELTFLSFVLFYALAQLLFEPKARRWLWGAVLFGGLVATVIGNYRAAWLSLVGGLIFMFFYLPKRQKWVLVGLSLLAALFLTLAVYALWDVQVVEGRSTIGQEIAAKANVTETTKDVNVVWRFLSYQNALEHWAKEPILGTGFGISLEFVTVTSTGGTMITYGHRVHNSFLWLLMTLGAAGFSFVLYMLFKYLQMVYRYLRVSRWNEGRITVIACGAFFVSFMISTSFEIFLESDMPITVLSCVLALTMLTIYYTPADKLAARR